MIEIIFWFLLIFLIHEFGHWIVADRLGLKPKIIWKWWGAEVDLTKDFKYLSFYDWWFISSAGLIVSFPLMAYLTFIYYGELLGLLVPVFWFSISLGDICFQIMFIIAKIQNPFFYFTKETQYTIKLQINQHGDAEP